MTAYNILPHCGPDHGASHWQTPDGRHRPFKLQSNSVSHGTGGPGGEGVGGGEGGEGGAVPLQPLWRQPHVVPAVPGFVASFARAARLHAELLAWNDHATHLLPLSFAQAAQHAVTVFTCTQE